MGITWKAMPLLSTLAALVIIVHSAEEDMDRGVSREYRNDYRARLLDTEPSNFDQPWRVIETEPMLYKSNSDIWEHSPERTLKRRKPARKRKRRPLVGPEEQNQEEIHAEENHKIESFTDRIQVEENHRDELFKDEIRAEENHRIESSKYGIHSEEDNRGESLRDRILAKENSRGESLKGGILPEEDRRGEPSRDGILDEEDHTGESLKVGIHAEENDRGESLNDGIYVKEKYRDESFPEVIQLYPAGSEVERFRDTVEPLRYRDTQYKQETTEMPRRRRKRPENRRNRWAVTNFDVERPTQRRVLRRKRPSLDSNVPRFSEFEDLRMKGETASNNAPKEDLTIGLQETEEIHYGNEYNLDDVNPDAEINGMHNDDKSTSVFSMEMVGTQQSNRPLHDDNKLKAMEKASFHTATNLLDKIRGDRPIDPMTLKEILKRSNGTSLSEILQQHNLSLSDLLRGKEDAMAMIKSEETSDDSKPTKEKLEDNLNAKIEDKVKVEQLPKEIIPVTEASFDNNESIQVPEANPKTVSDLESQGTGTETKQRKGETKQIPSERRDNEPKISPTRRNLGQRRKLRMRPSVNGTYKSQLNRDLMAQTARKYHNSRNITKSKEWKYVIPMMNESDSSEETRVAQSTTTSVPEETTTMLNTEYYNPTTVTMTTQTEANIGEIEDDVVEKETTTLLISPTHETTTSEVTTTTAKPRIARPRPAANRIGLRRQAYNNRLKRKRMKQKESTTKSPIEEDEFEVDLFGMPNLVSSAEFIARTQTPKPTIADDQIDDFTTLEDFITTEKSKHAESGPRFTRNSSTTYEEKTPENKVVTPRYISTTEETAKFEIEEILNDTRTSARLSKILMERNMTLNELVEHRERGSSHVHLADIFHNASKEPNPPEPFLTKSSIEPISRETYPLRAILEANLHESTAKTTIDPIPAETYAAGNIPVVMDFGNNVNENGENMGIMSLFDKFTDTDISKVEKSTIGQDSQGTPYVTTVILVNNTDANETTARESRVLKEEENNLKNDVVAWSQLFELMRKSQHQQNYTDEFLNLNNDDDSKHEILLQDSDGDGLIVLEDLQRLQDFNINTAREDKLDINSYEADTDAPGILNRSPSHSRSVTVATASIVGLAMILFLLTYAAFKWKQQRNLLRKKQNFPDERIPTPVFENRKGHKHNSSTRSISPMLATSNIYTLNTLDSNGKESPDYMWDSLRKPFQ